MTDMQKDEVLSGVENAVEEFNKRGREEALEPSPCLAEGERAEVKAALLGLIEECRSGGGVGEGASARLNAVARATEALMLL